MVWNSLPPNTEFTQPITDKFASPSMSNPGNHFSPWSTTPKGGRRRRESFCFKNTHGYDLSQNRRRESLSKSGWGRSKCTPRGTDGEIDVLRSAHFPPFRVSNAVGSFIIGRRDAEARGLQPQTIRAGNAPQFYSGSREYFALSENTLELGLRNISVLKSCWTVVGAQFSIFSIILEYPWIFSWLQFRRRHRSFGRWETGTSASHSQCCSLWKLRWILVGVMGHDVLASHGDRKLSAGVILCSSIFPIKKAV